MTPWDATEAIRELAALFGRNAEWRMRDWDDLRHFLAVARAGSALGGARRLGVNQTTCARRIAALEAAVGARLFERRQAGYRLTGTGQRVLAFAERVEAEVAALTQAVQAQRRMLAGTLRATTSESLANLVLTPFLLRFHEAHPEVRVDLILADRRLDLARGEADVALRAGPQPETTGVAVRHICHLGWTVYAAEAYAARHGTPARPEAMAGHAVMGGEGVLAEAKALRWIAALPGVEVISRTDSLTNMAAAAASGLCLAALPCMIGDRHPALSRCFVPVAGIGGELWLVAREEVREVPHMRAFLDALTAYLLPLRAMLAGEPAGEFATAGQGGSRA
jgi:DNA-binding transcriptional LysR family regulator